LLIAAVEQQGANTKQKKMKQLFKTTLLLALAVYTMNLHAQSYTLHQVIVLTDGNILESGGQHTRVGSYNPVTKVYQDFDTIAAQFGSHVIIDSGYIYVGADSLLIKYDLNTHAKLATQTVVGIREMAIWGNQILVTRANTFPLKSYFQAYSKSNLSLIYQDTTISYATEGIQVLNDSAYIAINDFGSGSVGLLGVEDLKGQQEKHEVNLGGNGLNPYSVFADPINQKIYTVNNLNYNGSTITDYNAPTTAFNNNSLHLSSGCTGSTYYLGNIYFQASNDADGNIGVFSTTTLTVWDSLKIHKFIYGMGIDSADGYMYVGQTDYETYGNVFIYNLFGAPIDSFAVDIGPGNFAFDIREVTAVPQVNASMDLQVYPNPTSDEIHINFTGTYKGMASLVMTDVLGREVYQSRINTGSPTTISLSALSDGVYFLTLETASGKTVKKIVKE
jgi:hypothetical protein